MLLGIDENSRVVLCDPTPGPPCFCISSHPRTPPTKRNPGGHDNSQYQVFSFASESAASVG